MQGVSGPRCPQCQKKLVPPTGPEDADILLCGPFPGWKEVKTGIPWTGEAGKILKAELAKQGLQFDHCRATNLWQHEPTPKGTKRDPNPIYKAELDWHFDQLRNEFRGRKAILIMGSETCRRLGLGEVEDISGLKRKSKFFPKSVEVAIAMVNPATVLRPGAHVGETRFAMENFAEALDEKKIWRKS